MPIVSDLWLYGMDRTYNNSSIFLQQKLSFLERWEVFRGEIRDHGKPFIEVTKAFGVSSCKVSSAAGDKYEMRWSAREGWSTIYRMTAGTLLVAEVILNYRMYFNLERGFTISGIWTPISWSAGEQEAGKSYTRNFDRERCIYIDCASGDGSGYSDGVGDDKWCDEMIWSGWNEDFAFVLSSLYSLFRHGWKLQRKSPSTECGYVDRPKQMDQNFSAKWSVKERIYGRKWLESDSHRH